MSGSLWSFLFTQRVHLVPVCYLGHDLEESKGEEVEWGRRSAIVQPWGHSLGEHDDLRYACRAHSGQLSSTCEPVLVQLQPS